jgi:ornithine cyclodeaminase
LRADLERDWPDLVGRLETTDDASMAVSNADIICTATTSSVPVFRDQDVRPGTHVSGVGAFTPEMQEVPAETVERATIVVDSVEAVLAEAGDLIIPLNQGRITQDAIKRELGALVNGDAVGRTATDEITFFKSVGNAVQDVVVGRYAVDRARALGVGTELNLS